MESGLVQHLTETDCVRAAMLLPKAEKLLLPVKLVYLTLHLKMYFKRAALPREKCSSLTHQKTGSFTTTKLNQIYHAVNHTADGLSRTRLSLRVCSRYQVR